MKKRPVTWMFLAAPIMLLIASPGWLSAADTDPFRFVGRLFGGGDADVASPQACGQCGKAQGTCECIERVPVKQCVTGKKKVYDCKIRYEYVSIPETKYRWVKKRVTKEIPCKYCMPICNVKKVAESHQVERWDTQPLGCSCGKLHCKTCQTKVVLVTCKHCGRMPGETTVKVHYWTCVKVPYTVYRQVKRPVCVSQPRYEKVDIEITKYECIRCKGNGCAQCGK